MAACATLHSGQPELALSDLTRSINIAPSANAYVARATIYRQRHNVPAAVSDLRAALELEPNNSNIRAALGYALWDSGDIAQSREMLEQAHKGLPDDPALIRQLAYVNQRLDDMPATQHYARLVIDDIDNQALITPLTPEQNQKRFNFRRLHEEVGRRWTFSFDSSIGLRSGAMSTANNNVGGAARGKAIVATDNWKPSTASDAICCWKATCSQFIAASLPIPEKTG